MILKMTFSHFTVYSHKPGYDREKSGFKFGFKCWQGLWWVTSGGRLHHVLAAAMGNARSPMVRRHVDGTVSAGLKFWRPWCTEKNEARLQILKFQKLDFYLKIL